MGVPTAENDGGAVIADMMQHVVGAGIEFVGNHHHRKGQDGHKPKALDDVYGSMLITAGAGSVVFLYGDPGQEEVELLHLKPPAEKVGPLKVRHDHAAGTSTLAHQVPREEVLRAVLAVLSEAGGPLGTSKIETAVRKRGVSVGGPQLRTSLAEWVQNPASGIEHGPDGKGFQPIAHGGATGSVAPRYGGATGTRRYG
jgi:hypothetical protein